MKEKDEGVIQLKEINKAVMEEELEFLYTGHVGKQNSYDLMVVADYFLLSSLKVCVSTLLFNHCQLVIVY